MKRIIQRIIAVCSILLLALTNGYAQNVNIPDVNFKNALLNHFPVINTDGDGEISLAEAAAFIGNIDVANKQIADLTGIEAFVNVKSLSCYLNQLTALDIRLNTKLTFLACDRNKLTALDVSQNRDLGTLWCHTNPLGVLDVTQNTKLTQLACTSNQLTHLDLTKNVDLGILHCNTNELTVLDLSKNTKLTYLSTYLNQLTTLDVSKNTALTQLYCDRNQLTALNVSLNTKLVYLWCYSNRLTSLDLSKNTALTSLRCHTNRLSSLDLSKNTALTDMLCHTNRLAILNLKNGNNMSIPNANFDIRDNPNLTCVAVDNAVWSTLNWIGKDVQTSYSVQCANNAPVINGLNGDSAAWPGAGNSVTLDVGGNATVSDAEMDALNGGLGNYDGASLVVERAGGTPLSMDVIGFNTSGALFSVQGGSLQSSGLTFATFTQTGGVLTINFNSSGTIATNALVNDVLKRITYRNDTPAGDADLKFTFSDGISSATANMTVTSDFIYITNPTDIPTINLADGVSFSEAVAMAAADATGAQTLVFTSTVSGTMTLAGSLSINESLTINADAAPNLVITGSNIRLGTGTTLSLTNTSGTVEIASTIAGAGSLGKTGNGTLSLTSNNNNTNWTGSLSVTGGTLVVGNGIQLSTGSLMLDNGTILLTVPVSNTVPISNTVLLGSNGGTIQVNGAGTASFTEVVSGGKLRKTGGGTLLLYSDGNTYGSTDVLNGTLHVNTDADLGSGAITMANGTTLLINSATTIDNNIALDGSATIGSRANSTLSGVLSGTGTLTKTGSGILTLSGTNSHSGAVSLAGGGLTLSGGSSIHDTAPVNLSAATTLTISTAETIGSLAGSGNVVLNASLSTGGNNISSTCSGVLSGVSNLVKTGSGTFSLTGTNTYAGSTTISAGTLQLRGGSAIPDDSPVSVAAGALLELFDSPEAIGSLAGAGNVSLNGNKLSAGKDNSSTVYSGIINGVGALSKTGTGTLTLSGANEYLGGTTLAGGTLIANDNNALGTGTVNMGVGAILGTTVEGTTLANLFSLGANATIRNDVSMTLSNAIQGVGGLTKMGTGTLTLSGDNAYLGTTAVSAGLLIVNGRLTETILVGVGPGATLAGNGEIFKNGLNNILVVESGGTLSPGNSPGILTLNGNLQMKSGSTLAIEINGVTPGTGYDQVVVNGGVDISRATLAVTHGYAALNGQQYTIITNDASDAVTGTFSGLAEGSTLTAGGNGTVLTSSYTGGTGNDFTLTAPVNTAPTNIILSGTTVNENVAPNTTVGTLSTTDADQGDTFTYSFVAGTGSTDNASFSLLGNSLNINASPDYETKTSYSVRIRSTDSYGATFEKVFLITVLDLNSPPVLAPIYNHIVYEGSMLTFTAKATDDGEPNGILTYSLVDAPAGARIDAVSGVFIWTPTEAQGPNSYTFDVVVSDGKLTDEQTITVTVMEVNTAPVLVTIGDKIVDEESLLTFEVVGTDSDLPANTLRYSLLGEPTGASIDPVTGVFTWIPTEAQGPRTYTFKVRLSDGLLYDEKEIKVTVNEVNVAPVATNDSYFIDEDTPLIIAAPGLLANDTDSDSPAQTLIAETVLSPAKGTLTLNANGSFTYIPNANFYGADSFRYWISDGSLWSNIATVTITVNPVNDAPIISGIPATTVDQDVVYSFIPTASDVDGDALTFSINNKPTWATFNTATGELTGTPSNADVGTTTGIVISVSDGTATVSLPVFAITVVNINDAPTISGTPATTVDQDVAYNFTPQATDIDAGDVLTFSITNKPTWATFNTTTGALTGTPRNADVGTTTGIVISVSDGTASVSLPVFAIRVVNVNDAPVIAGTPVTTVNQDAAYSFTPTATDIDAGDVLTFSITNKPTWAIFNTTTGALTGTPRNADVGTTVGILISVSDGTATVSLPVFAIRVVNVNDAPVIAGTPVTTVNQDAAYSFTPTATDIDAGDVLTFSITNKPAWATFNTTTGALTGTPRNADVGTTTGIVISVSDGTATVSLPVFAITVVNINDAPTISGTPATTVDQDVAYNFTPQATDIDAGDVLTFSITNKPTWATFNTTTGALTGTPRNADVGTTVGILISVSDGTASVSLPVFNLEVKTALITGISLEGKSFTYDGTAKSLAIKGTLPQGTTVSYTGNGQVNAGTTTVTAVISGGNYLPLTLTATLTILKATQTISFTVPGVLGRDAGKVALDVQSSSGLPVILSLDDPMVATVSGTDLNVLRLGTVRITAVQGGNENYEAASPVTVSVRIENDASAKLPIIVHQAVSPNGDGINEFLMIEGIRDYGDNKVTIFDKNGVVLAEIESYNNRDRVFFGNDHRDGTYYYYIDVKDGNTWKREKGFFVIKR